jgi:hypothetical protein
MVIEKKFRIVKKVYGTDYGKRLRLIPFNDIKKGDIFYLENPDGRRVGEAAWLATTDAYLNKEFDVMEVACDPHPEVELLC